MFSLFSDRRILLGLPLRRWLGGGFSFSDASGTGNDVISNAPSPLVSYHTREPTSVFSSAPSPLASSHTREPVDTVSNAPTFLSGQLL